MTNAQDTDQRFAWIAQHGGPVVDWADPRRHDVAGEGLAEWYASYSNETSKGVDIRKHVDEKAGTRMLEINPTRLAQSSDKPVYWSSTLKVGEGRYVRASGTETNFPAALALCEAHRHENREIGGLTWWRESEDRWISWLGPFGLSATKWHLQGHHDWHFKVEGEAATFEEAALLATMGRLDVPDAAGGQGT